MRGGVFSISTNKQKSKLLQEKKAFLMQIEFSHYDKGLRGF